MSPQHHIVGSESLGRPLLSPGYGALHRGLGMRRRHALNLGRVGAWTFLAVAGLSLIGVLAGTH